jgi:putative FmdB family regulatory protein
MPIYEFVCRACDRTFETLVRLGREGEVVCPSCGGREIRKLHSSFGIGGGSSRLKNSGSCTSCSSKSCSTCK